MILFNDVIYQFLIIVNIYLIKKKNIEKKIQIFNKKIKCDKNFGLEKQSYYTIFQA